jgi:hypothetical protein
LATHPGSWAIWRCPGDVEKIRNAAVDSVRYHSTDCRRLTPEQLEKKMQYLLMIYMNEAGMASASPEDIAKMGGEYGTFTKDIIKTGNFKGGEQLHPTSAATTVRVRDGKTLMTDGPFAETREQLAGYYVIEAKNLDEATAIAARIPGARTGSIEVRPITLMQQEDLARFGRA